VSDAAAFEELRAKLQAAVEVRATPAAVAEVGTRTGRLWTEAFGTLSFDAGAMATSVDTIFDLASLTKVIATMTLVLGQRAEGQLEFDTPIAELLPSWRGADRAKVTVRHLLDHSSGLPAHRRLWEHARGRHAYEAVIASTLLEAVPGERPLYSDLGFMLLGFILADLSGGSLSDAWDVWRRAALPRDTALGFGIDGPALVAPTEFDLWRGRILRGEVHDENAAALGGAAGHAGLFGTARAVGTFARLVLQSFQSTTPLASPEVMRLVVEPSRPPASRALAWDTMRPTSSCGTLMSAAAIGHTGFTGTSLWIDPVRDVYVVLLSNRVHPTRDNSSWPSLRAGFHDAAMRGWAASTGGALS
jgi:CubicO group peptidase (beta-lactamase class C family)